MEDRDLIEQALNSKGYDAQAWRDSEDGIEAVVGRAVVVFDDEDEGLYEGDEGELSVCVVGAARFANKRVCWNFMHDGTDGPVEVRDLDGIEVI